MAGTLFLVATPIGNLEDITLRALRVLREANLIAAEDTRRTARLLSHHGLSTPMLSFHEHNSHGRIPQLVQRLLAGDSIAVVTDAGTPGVSDPGLELVQACVEAGIIVDPIPGPSAPLAAVIASGFPVLPLTIFGFPPHRSKDRSHWFETLSSSKSTSTFFESPHRIVQTLRESALYLGERQIMVARELTKVHQEFKRGSSRAVADGLGDPKGEFTVVVAPPQPETPSSEKLSDEQIVAAIGESPENCGLSQGQQAAVAAKRLGLTRRDVYAALERVKKSGV